MRTAKERAIWRSSVGMNHCISKGDMAAFAACVRRPRSGQCHQLKRYGLQTAFPLEGKVAREAGRKRCPRWAQFVYYDRGTRHRGTPLQSASQTASPQGEAFWARQQVFFLKEIPHNTAAHLAVPFPTSAACRFLDLPPVNLRNLQLHLSKNSLAS